MRPLTLLTCCLILPLSACAASAEYMSAPEPYYDDAAAAMDMAEYAEDSMAAPAPAFEAPAAGLGTATPPGTVLASPAPVDPTLEPGDAIADTLETIGSDSVDQMLIFTGQLSLRVDFGQTDDAIDAAVNMAVAAGGYVAQMTDVSLRLRVPSRRFRMVMGQLEDLGEVESRGISALDVSEEFHDLEVQLENLKATRARIEKLLAQAKDLNQVLTIESELQRVTSEIDRLEGRMRLLSSQAAFSTIDMAVGERPRQQEQKIAIEEPPPPPPRTLSNSASWMSEVGVHGLMNFAN